MSKISSPFISALVSQGADPFRLLVESIVDHAIYMVDPEKRIASWNPGAERIYGYRAEEVIGQPFSTLFAPQGVTDDGLDEVCQLALASSGHKFESLHIRSDKSQFSAIATVSSLKDHLGNHAGYSVVTRNITAKRRAEQTEPESEEDHRRLLDDVRDAGYHPQRKDMERQFSTMVEGIKDYAIYTVDPTGIVTSWNEGAAHIFGFEAGEILGRHRNLLFTTEDVTAGIVQEEMDRAAAIGNASVDGWRVRKDGAQFWANGGMTVLHDNNGMVRGFIKIVRDLTERVDSEEALKQSEERYRSLFDAIADPLFVYDRETLAYLAVNNAAVQKYDYSRDEFLGMTIKDIRPVEDVSSLLEMLAASGTGPEDRGVWSHCKNDGTVMEMEISSHGLEYSGRPACVIQARDVTEKRRAEAEASRTYALLRSVADGMSDAVFVKDLSGKYLLFNKAASQFVGKSVEEVLGNDDTAIFDSDSACIAMESDRFVMEANQSTMREEKLTAAGVTRVYEAMKSPYRDASGNVAGVIGVSRDITQRKRAEEEMRQQQRLLRIAGQVAHIGGWSLDLATQEVTWSDEIREIHEVPPGYQPSLVDAINFYPPEYRERVAQYVRVCAEEGTPFDFELELITARGRRIWVRSLGEAVRDEDGRIVSLQGAFQDISDRKQAEAERRRLAERLATTLENITDGFVTFDREWRFVFVNAEAERMLDRRRDELIGKTLWEAFPEALGMSFEREYRRAVEQNVTVDFEEYFPPLAKWFGVRAYPSEQGLAVYFRDVTKSRNAEQTLRESEERFRLLSKATNDAIWDWDLTTDSLWWSDGFETLFGHPGDEIEPTIQSWLNYIHPEDKKGVVADVYRAIHGDAESWAGEYRYVCKDGSYSFVLDRGNIIREPGGKAVRMIGGMTDLTERKQAEEALRLRDRAIQAVSQGILITDPNQTDNPIVFASEGFERMTGYRSNEVIGKNCRFLQGHDTDPEAVRELRSAIIAVRICSVEILNYRKDGKAFWNQLTVTPVLGPAGQLTHFVGVQTDITEQRRLEVQYQQAQKMEAVGQLAGGVAHDFNNLLTIISGYSELLLEMPDVTSDVRESIVLISEASERAASLTRQLLGFSRQSLLQPKVLDLNAVVTETGKMLQRLIGEDILFTTILDPKLNPVKVDPGQLDQVLMNLAVNARDAMPKGGKLMVETSNVLFDDDYVATHPDCKAGHYVKLAMSDTGRGMKPEVAARIFEPFYTTKEVGRGTGLGLAMVFGIVQQSGGSILVSSEPGRGTTFKIYLPAVSEQDSAKGGSDSHFSLRGTETILLVEDEEAVRGLALRSLKMHGYQMLTATDGKDALRVMKSQCGPLDLILTDVVMPDVGGPELVRQLKTSFPGVKQLFMSGYTDDAVVRHGLIEAEVAFIQKPYTPLGLCRKVRQVLDEKSTHG